MFLFYQQRSIDSLKIIAKSRQTGIACLHRQSKRWSALGNACAAARTHFNDDFHRQ